MITMWGRTHDDYCYHCCDHCHEKHYHLKIAVIALDIEFDYFGNNNVHNNRSIKLLELVE